jgi:hypothetical protein
MDETDGDLGELTQSRKEAVVGSAYEANNVAATSPSFDIEKTQTAEPTSPREEVRPVTQAKAGPSIPRRRAQAGCCSKRGNKGMSE